MAYVWRSGALLTIVALSMPCEQSQIGVSGPPLLTITELKALAGPEPPPEKVFAERIRRQVRRGGRMSLAVELET